MGGVGARMVSGQLLATLAAGIGLVLLMLAALTYGQISGRVQPTQTPAPRPSAVATVGCRPATAARCGSAGG
jgi:hypothetical protein